MWAIETKVAGQWHRLGVFYPTQGDAQRALGEDFEDTHDWDSDEGLAEFYRANRVAKVS